MPCLFGFGAISLGVFMIVFVPNNRGVFLSAFGVAHFTAFMQWTGMLGKIPSSMIVEEVLECFYAQLDLSSDILNPVKYSADDRSRSSLPFLFFNFF